MEQGISSDIRVKYNISSVPVNRRLTNKLDVEIEDFLLDIYEPIEFKTFELTDATTIKITSNNPIINNNIQKTNFIIYTNDMVKDIDSISINGNELIINILQPISSDDVVSFTYTVWFDC